MGSLIGHVVPGTAFTVVAIWWTFDLFLRYYESKFKKTPLLLHYSSPGRKSPASYHYLPPWEITFRLVMIIIGMIGEYVTALDENWHFKTIHNGQHMTMFAFFLLPTLFEMFYFYQMPGLPPALDVLTGAIAFGAEAVLFIWHLHGRTNIDIQVHTFLVYAIVMCSLSMGLEMFTPDNILPILVRCGFTLVQGVWFFAIGLILYPPKGWQSWNPDDHHHMMVVTMMFTWHVAGVIFFQIFAAFLSYKIVKRKMNDKGSYFGLRNREEGLRKECKNNNDLTLSLMCDGSDEEEC